MYEGKLVRLRALREEDAELCVLWLNDLDTARRVRGGGAMPFSLAGEKKWIEEHAGPMRDQQHFAIETLEGVPIGVCSYHQLNWQSRRCMVGWFIGDKSARNKGYGTDMIRLLLKICFLELDMHKVSLRVFSYNEEAVRLYERVGFAREATFREKVYAMGRRWDDYEYGMLRVEYDALYGGDA